MTTSSRRALAVGAGLVAVLAASGCGRATDTASPASADAPLPATSSATSPTPVPSTPVSTPVGPAASATSPSGPPASRASSPAAASSTGVAAGDAVAITAPQPDEHLPAGVVRITGTGTAPEGNLLWRFTDAAGTVVAGGHTGAGANGQVGGFTIEQTVPTGTCAPCTVRVWVPDDSDGEGSGGTAAATRTFSVD